MKRLASKLSLFAVVVAVTSCGDPEIVVPEVLSVVTVLPAHGSAEITVDVEGLVYFSHPLADAAAASAAIRVECLGTPPCSAPTNAAACPASIDADLIVEANDQVVHLQPTTALTANTCYALVVGEGIEASDENVGPLPVDIRSSFYTR